jgi:hypothetical protein
MDAKGRTTPPIGEVLRIRLPDIRRRIKLDPKTGVSGEMLLLNELGALANPGLTFGRAAAAPATGGGDGDLEALEND